MSATSQQPYFLRAIYEWCVDNGLTPHLTVQPDDRARVPTGYLKDGQIVLNVGPSAVRNLQMDNDWVTFSARFGGVAQEIFIPVDNVLAIYARETGEGMAFAPDQDRAANSTASERESSDAEAEAQSSGNKPTPGRPSGRPNLRVVK